MVGVLGQPEPLDDRLHPGGRLGRVSRVRRSVNAMSSRTVGITIWVSGSVNTNPTRSRTCLPFAGRPGRRPAPAAVRLDQPVDRAGQRGLAGAVGADDADPRFGQREMDVVEHEAVTESMADVLEHDLAHVHRRSAPVHRVRC